MYLLPTTVFPFCLVYVKDTVEKLPICLLKRLWLQSNSYPNAFIFPGLNRNRNDLDVKTFDENNNAITPDPFYLQFFSN